MTKQNNTRETLFKAKRVDTKEYVYGILNIDLNPYKVSILEKDNIIMEVIEDTVEILNAEQQWKKFKLL